MEKKKRSFPHPVIFILLLCLIMLVFTWIIPEGHYVSIDANGVVEGQEGYDASTGVLLYDDDHYVVSEKPVRLGIWGAMNEIVNGMLAAKSITFLIFCAFAVIYIIEKTGALDAIIASCVRLAEKNKAAAPIIIVIIMFIMAFWGGTGTISYEEIGAFIPIFMLLCISMGFDPMVAMSTCVFSMGFGFASGYANPFTTGTAHSIVGLTSLSGAPYRVVCLLVTVGFLAWYTLHYGNKVKKNPQLSVTADMDFSDMKIDEERKATKFTPVRVGTLLSLVFAVGLMFYELMFKGQYIDCCTAIFLCCLFMIMFVRWLVPKIQNKIAGKEIEVSVSPSETMADYFVGAGKAALPALTVGFGYGVSMIMTAGGIKDPLIHAMIGLLESSNIYVAIVFMFFFQTLLNFVVPSGSGQAAIAMPLIGPIATGIGLNLQSATLAFNFGDGFSNLIWPTAYGIMLPVLAGIPVDRYYKWTLKLFLWVTLILIILLEVSLFLWQGKY